MFFCQNKIYQTSLKVHQRTFFISVPHRSDQKVGSDSFLSTQTKLSESWKAIQQWKLSSNTPTPLVKWLHKIQDKETASVNREIMDKLRKKYPQEAAEVDRLVDSLTPGFVSEEMQREHPEFNRTLSDLEVFEFLMQFVDPKDKQEKHEHIRTYLAEEFEKKEKLNAELRRIDREEADLLAPHFPDYYRNMTNPLEEAEHQQFGEKEVSSSETYTTELLARLDHPSNPWNKEYLTKEEFFAGIDPRSSQSMAIREKQWEKYVKIVELVKMQEVMEDKTPEMEPLIEAAMDFNKIFRQSSVGKYIRFTNREQRKFIPEGWGGKLEYREFPMTNETSLLMRQPTMDAINLLKNAEKLSFSRRGPSPSIFFGDGGVGKSACLQLVVYWARKSGWLVVNIKNGTKWVHSGGIITKSKLIDGCWDQPHLGVKFLGHMLDAHSDKLKQIPLRTHFELGQFSGKTLFDLVEYGAALHEFSCDVVYHFKKELERVIEFPVLIAIDDYNSLYNYNQRFREPETKRFKPRKLQNKNLTLARIFMDCHNDHQLINGTFIGALCREVSYRNFEIEKNKGKDWIEVPGFTPYETDKLFQHYERTKYVFAETSEETRKVIRQLCDGRGHEMWRWAKAL